MKHTKYLIILILCLTLISCSTQSKVSGDVFVATAGAGNYKLGAVSIKFYQKKRIQEIEAKGEIPAFDYLKTDGQATSDADGKFTVTLPRGEYYAIASAERKVLDGVEFYNWSVPFKADQAEISLSLNNQNMNRKQ